MGKARLRAWWGFVVIASSACSSATNVVGPDAQPVVDEDGSTSSRDAGRDAGDRDSGIQDAATGHDAGAPPDAGGGQKPMFVFVGTGDWGSADGRVISHHFDPSNATLTQTATIAAGAIASFLAFDPVRRVVHVADEGAGRVLSFAIADDVGRLRQLDSRPTRGNPVFVSLTASRRLLLVAHYGAGRAEVFGLQANGAIDDATDVVDSGGQSHSIRVSPDDRFALVPAKADDWIAQYAIDGDQLTANVPARVSTAAGAGPRHLDFHPDGAYAYVINELDNTIDAYSYDATDGTLTNLMTVSALPQNFNGRSTGADIHVHPNGRFLYASERVVGGPGLIAIFAIDANGALTLVGHEETRGETPRNFALSPNGAHLIAANQSSGTLAVFTLDDTTGRLTFVRTQDLGANPFFVGFVR